MIPLQGVELLHIHFSLSVDASKKHSEIELASWKEVIQQWATANREKPDQLKAMIYCSIPKAFRGDVWLRLTGCTTSDASMMDNYQVYISKEYKADSIIVHRDVRRTFPALDFFNEGGQGRQALYKICSAYAVHDKELGYCQVNKLLSSSCC